MSTFLVPPGMGDIYWSLTKIKSLAERDNVEKIDIVIWPEKTRRSESYPPRFSMVNSSTIPNHDMFPGKQSGQITKEIKNSPTGIETSFYGFDYLVWFNDVMERGAYLDTDILPELTTDWYPEMTYSHVEYAFGKNMKKYHKDYIVLFIVNPNNMYKDWRKFLGYPQIYHLCQQIKYYFGYNIVMMGVEWDRESFNNLKSLDEDDIIIDMIGRTNVDQLFGMIKNAKAVIGDSAGNVLMSTYFKVPTFTFWSDEHFPNKNFFLNTVSPDSIGKWYYPICVRNYQEKEILDGLETIRQNGEFYKGSPSNILSFFKEKLNV